MFTYDHTQTGVCFHDRIRAKGDTPRRVFHVRRASGYQRSCAAEGVFPDPRPTNLITVPACQRCNESSKLDDEYFRWFVATASAEHPEAQRLVEEKVIPRFRERPALLHSVMKHTRMVDVYSEGGIYLGTQPGFEFDRPRVQRIVDKIVRGLYVHEKDRRLGEGYLVKDFVLNPSLSDETRSNVASMQLREIGGDIFGYRFQQCSEDDHVTMWFLMFYEQCLIMSMTDVEWELPTG